MDLNKECAAVDIRIIMVTFMQVNDVHHISLNQFICDQKEVQCTGMHIFENLSQSDIGNIRQKPFLHHPAPHAPLETVTAASAAASMNIMYSLLTYPTLHDNLHGLRQCGACSQIQFTQS